MPAAGVALAFPGGGAPVELTPRRAVAFGGYRFARPRAAADGRRRAAARRRLGRRAHARRGRRARRPGPRRRPDDRPRAVLPRLRARRAAAALLALRRAAQPGRAAHGREGGAGLPRLRPAVDAGRPPRRGARPRLLAARGRAGADGRDRGAPRAGRPRRAPRRACSWPRASPSSLRFAPRRRTRTTPTPRSSWPDWPSLVVLLLVDRGAVLAWSFGVAAAAGRVPLAGVGVLLGAALVAALGGSLLLGGADGWRATGEGARPAGRAALGLAVAAGGSRPPARGRPRGGAPRGSGRRLSPGSGRRRGGRGRPRRRRSSRPGRALRPRSPASWPSRFRWRPWPRWRWRSAVAVAGVLARRHLRDARRRRRRRDGAPRPRRRSSRRGAPACAASPSSSRCSPSPFTDLTSRARRAPPGLL